MESSMISKEQLNKWFTHHPPTPETAPKYAAIREAESVAARPLVAILNGGTLATYDAVNTSCRAFVEAVDANAPGGDDKAAAIRCVRLARNAANEALALHATENAGHPLAGARPPESDWQQPSYNVIMLVREAEAELRRARWQANSAIACGSAG